MEAFALLFLLLLGGGRKKSESKSETRSLPEGSSSKPALPAPGVNVFATAWKTRTSSLVKRGLQGVRWTPMLEKAFAGNTDAAVASARWVGIESSGDPKTKTSLGEYGLAQGMKENYSAEDWKIVTNPKSTDEQHAKAAAHLILKSVIATTGMPTLTAGTIGLGKLYHALPLLVRELRTQSLLKPSVAETLVAMLGSYKPSDKVASYAKGQYATTGNINQDLVLRFLAPAAVVAYGDAAVTLLDKFTEATS